MEREQRVSAWVSAHRVDVATKVTAAFYDRHPDWLARYGDAGRARGLEDALFHLDFLAGAVRAASPTAFATYAGWVGQVLRARGLPPDALGEHLDLLREELAGALGAEDRAAVDACFAAAVARLAAGDDTPALAEDEAAEVYMNAALRGDRRAALGVAREALARGWSPRRVYAGILAAAQRRVGALWVQNRITVADEHIATAATQWVVAMLYGELAPPAPTRGRVLVAGVEGELHQLGARMLADLLEVEGYEVRYLGTNTPADAVIRAARAFRPDIVGLSATLLARLPATLDLARTLTRTVAPPPALVVGGHAFRDVDVVAEAGAVGVATDLENGLDLVRGLGIR